MDNNQKQTGASFIGLRVPMDEVGNIKALGAYKRIRVAAEILGIEMDLHHPKGKPNTIIPLIQFAVGEGAGFSGVYQYRKGSVVEMGESGLWDETLNGIAFDLQQLQRAHFYKLKARCVQGQKGSVIMDVHVESTADASRALTRILQQFATWIYYEMLEELV